jgi:Protein of unknown function DUF262/Protein of unknown function (DUF1524)
MSATNFKTENNTYRKLIGNGLTYKIPPFQRDYSWTETEWEDLWADILATVQEGGEPAHYMGYLVLQSSDDKVFDVIDGQQRLTTLSLIVLAALKNLHKLVDADTQASDNQKRIEQIRQTYIGYLDPVTLVSRSKLTLNRNNNLYFQNYLVPLGHLPVRGFKASEHGLRKAFEWFDAHVADYVKQVQGDAGVALASLVENMSDRLFFTVINVTDELNAYKVFETLNARGVKLSATDLLKNYLFSLLHRHTEHAHEMKVLEDRWEAMVERLGSESFPDFLRVHWMSRRAFVRKAELFKAIRDKVRNREEVFELLRGMEEDMDVYLSLTSPEASQWNPKLKGYVRELRLFGVKQPFPSLIAAHRTFSDSEFEALLRACVVISMRYNIICGKSPNEQETVYASVAKKITQGEYSNASAALLGMKSIYPSDETFNASFTEKVMRARTPKMARYILCALEKQAGGQDYDFESDALSVEHIFPQNSKAGWDAFSDEEAEALVYRLGNMALLDKSANRDLGNAEFSVKKAAFAASHFQLTAKVASDNLDWTPVRIAMRQKQMAKLATAFWRIPQLS